MQLRQLTNSLLLDQAESKVGGSKVECPTQVVATGEPEEAAKVTQTVASGSLLSAEVPAEDASHQHAEDASHQHAEIASHQHTEDASQASPSTALLPSPASEERELSKGSGATILQSNSDCETDSGRYNAALDSDTGVDETQQVSSGLEAELSVESPSTASAALESKVLVVATGEPEEAAKVTQTVASGSSLSAEVPAEDASHQHAEDASHQHTAEAFTSETDGVEGTSETFDAATALEVIDHAPAHFKGFLDCVERESNSDENTRLGKTLTLSAFLGNMIQLRTLTLSVFMDNLIRTMLSMELDFTKKPKRLSYLSCHHLCTASLPHQISTDLCFCSVENRKTQIYKIRVPFVTVEGKKMKDMKISPGCAHGLVILHFVCGLLSTKFNRDIGSNCRKIFSMEEMAECVCVYDELFTHHPIAETSQPYMIFSCLKSAYISMKAKQNETRFSSELPSLQVGRSSRPAEHEVTVGTLERSKRYTSKTPTNKRPRSSDSSVVCDDSSEQVVTRSYGNSRFYFSFTSELSSLQVGRSFYKQNETRFSSELQETRNKRPRSSDSSVVCDNSSEQVVTRSNGNCKFYLTRVRYPLTPDEQKKLIEKRKRVKAARVRVKAKRKLLMQPEPKGQDGQDAGLAVLLHAASNLREGSEGATAASHLREVTSLEGGTVAAGAAMASSPPVVAALDSDTGVETQQVSSGLEAELSVESPSTASAALESKVLVVPTGEPEEEAATVTQTVASGSSLSAEILDASRQHAEDASQASPSTALLPSPASDVNSKESELSEGSDATILQSDSGRYNAALDSDTGVDETQQVSSGLEAKLSVESPSTASAALESKVLVVAPGEPVEAATVTQTVASGSALSTVKSSQEKEVTNADETPAQTSADTESTTHTQSGSRSNDSESGTGSCSGEDNRRSGDSVSDNVSSPCTGDGDSESCRSSDSGSTTHTESGSRSNDSESETGSCSGEDNKEGDCKSERYRRSDSEKVSNSEYGRKTESWSSRSSDSGSSTHTESGIRRKDDEEILNMLYDDVEKQNIESGIRRKDDEEILNMLYDDEENLKRQQRSPRQSLLDHRFPQKFQASPSTALLPSPVSDDCFEGKALAADKYPPPSSVAGRAMAAVLAAADSMSAPAAAASTDSPVGHPDSDYWSAFDDCVHQFLSQKQSFKRTLKRKRGDDSLMSFEEIMASEGGNNAFRSRVNWKIKMEMLEEKRIKLNLPGAKTKLKR